MLGFQKNKYDFTNQKIKFIKFFYRKFSFNSIKKNLFLSYF